MGTFVLADDPTQMFECKHGDSLLHGVAHVFKDDASVDTLTLELRIVCARCGYSVVTLPGHHLIDIQNIIAQVQAKFPMQVGKLAELQNPQGES